MYWWWSQFVEWFNPCFVVFDLIPIPNFEEPTQPLRNMKNPLVGKHGNGNTPSHRGPNGTGLPEHIFPFWTNLKKGDSTRWATQQSHFFGAYINVLKTPMCVFLHRIRTNLFPMIKPHVWMWHPIIMLETQKWWNTRFCWSNGFLHLSFPFDINSILVGGLEDVLFFHILGSSFHPNWLSLHHFSEG